MAAAAGCTRSLSAEADLSVHIIPARAVGGQIELIDTFADQNCFSFLTFPSSAKLMRWGQQPEPASLKTGGSGAWPSQQRIGRSIQPSSSPPSSWWCL